MMMMANDDEVDPQLPQCPTCGARFEYARINVAKPFDCPSCGNKLMVSEAYTKRWRAATYVLFLLSCLALALNNVHLLFLAPVVFIVIGVVGSIVSKRIFQPPLEDVVAKSKEARYTPL
jgi:uncharacterized paraquat-inducible protein A